MPDNKRINLDNKRIKRDIDKFASSVEWHDKFLKEKKEKLYSEFFRIIHGR